MSASEMERLRDALHEIAEWILPPSGRTWDDGRPMSYGAAFGSNGERDYFRNIARRALALSGGSAPQAAVAPEEITKALRMANARLLENGHAILVGGASCCDACDRAALSMKSEPDAEGGSQKGEP